MLQRLPVVLCVACIGIGLLGILASIVPVLSIAEDNLGLHLLYRMRGAEKPETDVVIVAIDRESAKALNLPTAPQKWPRKLHARLLDQLIELDAAAVAFDLIFYEPQHPADDQALAAAIRKAGNVVLTQPIDRETMPLLDHNNMPVSHVSIEKMVSAITVLAEAAIGQASFPLPKVPIKLNQYWRFSPGAGDVPTLPVVVMHIYAMDEFHQFLAILREVAPQSVSLFPAVKESRNEARQVIKSIRPIFMLFESDSTLTFRMMDELEQRFSKSLSPETVNRIKAFIKLYGSGSSSYLNFYGPPRTVPTISYSKLLEWRESEDANDHMGRETLRGKVFFIGQTESDWFKANDGFHTAFTEVTGMDISGVEVAATAFANLMEDKVVRAFGPIYQVLILFGWGSLVSLIAFNFSAAVSTIGLLAVNGLYLWLAHVQFKSNGVWYPLVVPILVQAPAAYIAGLAWKYGKANVERRNIREAFGYYLPDDVVKRLAANAKALRGGGQVLYSICLFTDAAHYTTLSERMDPESLTNLMNRYYETIFKPIKENGGLVLQVVGDSVLAMWTAPQPQDDLKISACQAAIDITKAVERFNSIEGEYALPTRIGLHAGEVLLGNIGAMDHFEYRPVGDIVNTASRLEGLNKYLGTRVLASQEVVRGQNGDMSRSMGKFIFKGKNRPVHVNELVCDEDAPDKLRSKICQGFASGLQAFEKRQWEEADAHFQQVLEMDDQDGPSKFYSELCRAYRNTPPPNGWDGAVMLSNK